MSATVQDHGPDPTPSAGAAVPAGTMLGPRLQVLGLLHEGHRITVYDAWDDGRDCRVVAKALRPDHAGDRQGARQLRSEGRLLAALTHPHVVRHYDTLRTPDPVVVLETLPGHTVDALLDEHERLALPDVLHLGLQLCSAIGYLHRSGWLHLDVKPANVIADGGGRAKLIDLSIARRPGPGVPGLGTRGYLPPEQAVGGVLGPAADVWGIGGLLYECLAGEPARPVSPGTQTAPGGPGSREAALVPSVPLRRRRRVPLPVASLVDGMLDLDPDRRPDVSTCVAGLREALGG
ncbi:MAG: serine/threonine protein kinase [Geodermatophilaceae bacterium]|nr:serine/threonine protein kinase [Geodermatophilaceae bacterium]